MEYAKRIDSILQTQRLKLQCTKKIKNDAKISADTLREIVDKKPDYIVPLVLAYEFTDGGGHGILEQVPREIYRYY